uniref:Uncharacterized protein n=1 Tax=Arundo donax TaxID=35708 RepID=A0A0A8Y374_ARUDO
MLLPKYALPQMRIQCSPEAMAMSRCQLLLTGLCKLHHPFAVINLSLSLSLSVSLSLSLSSECLFVDLGILSRLLRSETF